MAKAPKAAPAAAPSLARRGVALGAFVLTAALFGYGMSRPWATTLRNEAFTLGPGETLSIVDPGAAGAGAPLFTFLGPVGRNVIVRLDRASLDAAAPPELALPLASVAAGPVPLAWSLREGGRARAVVAVGLRPDGARPALTLAPGGTPDVSELTLGGEHARLALVMHGAATGGDAAGPPDPPGDLIVSDPARPDQELLRVETPSGGALPVPVVSEAGRAVFIRYAGAAQGGSYRLGSGLAATSLRVRSETGPDRFAACGSRPGVSWTGGDVARLACLPTLKITSLALGPDGVTYKVSGTAFVAREGKSTNFPVQNFKENPVIAAGLSAVMGALATWTLKTVFAPFAPARARRPARPRR